MSKTNLMESTILNMVFGGTAYTPPATLYVALFSAVTDAEAGTVTELSGSGYARVAVTNNVTNWPAASAGSKSNGTVITFPTATAAWLDTVSWGIYDAATAGNLLYYLTTPFVPAKVVQNGDTASFAAGALVITES